MGWGSNNGTQGNWAQNTKSPTWMGGDRGNVGQMPPRTGDGANIYQSGISEAPMTAAELAADKTRQDAWRASPDGQRYAAAQQSPGGMRDYYAGRGPGMGGGFNPMGMMASNMAGTGGGSNLRDLWAPLTGGGYNPEGMRSQIGIPYNPMVRPQPVPSRGAIDTFLGTDPSRQQWRAAHRPGGILGAREMGPGMNSPAPQPQMGAPMPQRPEFFQGPSSYGGSNPFAWGRGSQRGGGF